MISFWLIDAFEPGHPVAERLPANSYQTSSAR